MERTLRLGIAGLGNAGHAVLRCVEKVAAVELGAVADVREPALQLFKEKNRDVAIFSSVAEMCASTAVDAVWIATPNPCHADHVVAAARHGKHVICEKPMALSLAECDRMIEAAENNNVKLLLHSKVSDPPISKIREIVAGGRLGRVIQIHTCNYKGWLQQARLASELDTAQGGGVVFRQGPHQVDIVRCLGGGMVRSVRAVTGRWNPTFATEGNYTAFLQFEDQTPAILVFNGYGYFDMTELTWDIGEGGRKVSNRYGKKERIEGAVDPATRYSMPLRAATRKKQGARQQPIYGLTVVSCAEGDIRQSPDGLYLYTGAGREEVICPPFLDRGMELLKLRDAALKNQRAFTDGRWGKATLEVVQAILQSSKEGREIFLRHQVPSY